MLSFDIFGFALEPTVLEADDIHRLVASHVGDSLEPSSGSPTAWWVAMRELAEERARAAAAESGTGVIGMPAVRQHLADVLGATDRAADGPGVARAAIRREIELHRAVWRANPIAHELYRDAVAAGIGIAFLADSPLPRDLVTRILHRAGFQRGEVLVSSQEGATKDAGDLFTTLAERVGVDCERIMHLGPDRRADGDRPTEAGLQIWPAGAARAEVVHRIATGLVERTGVDAMVLALAADRLAAAGSSPTVTDLGYYAAGPLATGFCWSVGRTMAATSPDHVLFCGPSGRLLRQVTSVLWPGLPTNRMHELGSIVDGQPAPARVTEIAERLGLRDGHRVLAVDLGWDDQPHRWLRDGILAQGTQVDVTAAYVGVQTALDEAAPATVWALTGADRCALTLAAHDRFGPLSALVPTLQTRLADVGSDSRALGPTGHRLASGVIEFARDAAPLLATLPDELSPALIEPVLRLLDAPSTGERALLATVDDSWTDPTTPPAGPAEHPLTRWRRKPPAKLRSRPPARGRRP